MSSSLLRHGSEFHWTLTHVISSKGTCDCTKKTVRDTENWDWRTWMTQCQGMTLSCNKLSLCDFCIWIMQSNKQSICTTSHTFSHGSNQLTVIMYNQMHNLSTSITWADIIRWQQLCIFCENFFNIMASFSNTVKRWWVWNKSKTKWNEKITLK